MDLKIYFFCCLKEINQLVVNSEKNCYANKYGDYKKDKPHSNRCCYKLSETTQTCHQQ